MRSPGFTSSRGYELDEAGADAGVTSVFSEDAAPLNVAA